MQSWAFAGMGKGALVTPPPENVVKCFVHLLSEIVANLKLTAIITYLCIIIMWLTVSDLSHTDFALLLHYYSVFGAVIIKPSAVIVNYCANIYVMSRPNIATVCIRSFLFVVF